VEFLTLVVQYYVALVFPGVLVLVVRHSVLALVLHGVPVLVAQHSVALVFLDVSVLAQHFGALVAQHAGVLVA